MQDVTKLPAWQALAACKPALPPLKDLFAADPRRFEKFSITLPGLLADFSKHPVTEEVRDLLVQLAHEAGLDEQRRDFLSGAPVNVTENRPALHVALRAPAHSALQVAGKNIMPEVQQNLLKMRIFAEAVRNGEWRGHSGRMITDIVNIGIGGSHLGPQLATEALSRYHHPRLTCHYVSNADASDLGRTLRRLSPETTLFIVASKTFTTSETMQNASLARDWLAGHFKGDKASVAAHFVAASTNGDAVRDFGIGIRNMFPFQDWVGGRYSLWSAVGLSTLVMIGPQKFQELLAGAHDMDAHFRDAPFAQNLPVMLALIGIWHRNFLGHAAQAVIPYHSLLRRLPSYLQQLDMESNGKSATRDGSTPSVKTGPIIFGEPGTDAQHIFFQWLHQGPDIVPVDFVAAIETAYEKPAQQNMLLANFLAQSEGLLLGRDDPSLHRRYDGNRPSTTLLLDRLDPHALGMLLALYEHKVFVQGAIWGINSFDQFGVELGKTLARTLEKEIEQASVGLHDSSTRGLLQHVVSRLKKPKEADKAA